ncbi:MAG TPA: transcriptional repressor LexA [Alphaproteobacteria bacterium]|nr:transcriptional repressor LexA [Alphaproteobacteria bacterium]
MLTRKQKELLLLIRDRLAAEGVPPSFDEMKDALGLRSKSGIHRLITGLEERGFIKRLPHRARALEIARLPEGFEPAKPAGKIARKARLPDMAAIVAQTVSLPLYGRIAAGVPIEAMRDPDARIDVPVGLIASTRGKVEAGDHYALEVSGDSMIEEGIKDGDRVIIKKCDHAENGAIVVALIGGEDEDKNEVTLKKLEKRGNQIALIPANKNYETRVFDPRHVRVQGRLVGLVRRY